MPKTLGKHAQRVWDTDEFLSHDKPEFVARDFMLRDISTSLAAIADVAEMQLAVSQRQLGLAEADRHHSV